MNNTKITHNSDIIGMVSSFLCLLHCIAMPFVLAFYSFQDIGHKHSSHAGHVHAHAHGAFNWDYFFVLLCLLAVWSSARNQHATPLLKGALWGFFAMFSIGILFETYAPFFQYLGYIASLGLILSHWQNYRVCRVAH